MDLKLQNIFAKVTIGSSVVNGNFTDTNFGTPISFFMASSENDSFLTGHSQTLQTNQMNMVSVGFSGSYGISGISKVEASVAGYINTSSSSDTNSLDISFNVWLTAGMEQIQTKELSTSDLINALATNPKNAMLKIIDNYNSMMAALNASPSLPEEKVDELITQWASGVQSFITTYGPNFVAAIHWGAIGQVLLKINNADGSSMLQYGEEANFSYSGLEASAAIKEVFNTSKSQNWSNVSVNYSSYLVGNSSDVKSYVDDWIATAKQMTSTALADKQFTAVVPALPTVAKDSLPSIPPFQQPEKVSSVTEKMNATSSLDKLEEALLKSAYFSVKDQYKSFEDFKEKATAPIPADSVKAVRDIPSGELDMSFLKEKPEDVSMEAPASQPLAAMAADENSDNTSNSGRSSFDSFVPLGILLYNWQDVFPWMSVAVENLPGNLDTAKTILKWRVMMQDTQLLFTLYSAASQMGLDAGSIKSIEVANEFKQMNDKLRSVALDDKFAGDKSLTYQQKLIICMQESYQALSTPTAKIYDLWTENNFLRNAELGMAPMTHVDGQLVVAADNANYLGCYYHSGDFGKGTLRVLGRINWQKTSFDIKTGNYSAFAETIKVYPLITPDGDVFLFNNLGVLRKAVVSDFGDISSTITANTFLNNTFLSSETVNCLAFNDNGAYEYQTTWNTVLKPIRFVLDKENERIMAADYNDLFACPVPARAAKGITWKGASMASMNLAENITMNTQLNEIADDFSNSKNWSLASDTLTAFQDGNFDVGLSDIMKDKYAQYYGLIDRPKFMHL